MKKALIFMVLLFILTGCKYENGYIIHINQRVKKLDHLDCGYMVNTELWVDKLPFDFSLVKDEYAYNVNIDYIEDQKLLQMERMIPYYEKAIEAVADGDCWED